MPKGKQRPAELKVGVNLERLRGVHAVNGADAGARPPFLRESLVNRQTRK